jgi:nucleotide-binding universal stress UspA family protein
MSATAALLIIGVVWLAIGAVCAFVMARRGHDPYGWGVLGALWGPLVVPIALARRRDEASMHDWSRIERTGEPGPGSVRVLVGVDGSVDAEAAAVAAKQLLGPRLQRLTLAAVVDYEDAGDVTSGDASNDEVHRALEGAVAALDSDVAPETVVLAGPPAPTLLGYACDHDYDVIVVGARGTAMSRAFAGHVTSHLIRQHAVPVLVAGMPRMGEAPLTP